MKFSREFKIGLFAVAVLLVTWWGIKWLEGQNLRHRSDVFYVYYDSVVGLQESSRVTLRGVDVGNVRAIELGRDSVKVALTIEHNYIDLIPNNSIAEICSAGLMGGVEVAILQGDASEPIAPYDVLCGRVRPDMLGELTTKGTELMEGMTQTVESVNRLLAENSRQLTSFVANLERVSLSVNSIIASSKGHIDSALADVGAFAKSLAESTDNIERIVANFDALTADAAEQEVVAKLSSAIESLNVALTTLNEGEGTASKLLSDKALYESLTEAGDNLGLLLEDLRTNPSKYVHFSLFGGHGVDKK